MNDACFDIDKLNKKHHEEKEAKLETNVPFKNGCPCRLVKRQILGCMDIGFPHYATTLEMLVIENTQGIVRIASNEYVVQERSVFVIPPNVIHTTSFMPGNGSVYVFKISFELLDQYLNTENLFSSKGHSISDVPYCLSQHYTEIKNILFNKISYDGKDILKTVLGITRLFHIFDDAIESHKEKENQCLNQSILEVMQWTTENLSEHITVEMAAQKANYSKYYFCKMFKKYTGNTYLKYLQLLRVKHAVELLKDGKTMTDCCYECGFSSLSHFVKLFKMQTGYTPSEYKRVIAQNNGGKNE